MRLALAFVAFGLLVVPRAAEPPQQELQLTAGMVIDRSARIRPGIYRVPSQDLENPAIRVRGNGVTVDLTGVTIEGGEPYADPDSYTGAGIVIEESAAVTIRGGAVRGYKVGILARQTPRLHITRTDLSYNWKPRLKSDYEQEHQSDWLSFHHNERNEWLRYGAAIYLDRADDAEIDHVRAVQGMNGLLVSRSARLRIWNNTFSFLSGLGVGLYRVSDSRIMHNRLDYCVRGYSHGFYYRGQDSSALLMYEQTSNNVVAYNSMTHGGDGVFLWAGQSTMDTGKGGANDNLFYGNDVSHAVANGIEATFSRNTIAHNRIDDSWHGIWGGYSYDSLIADNTFSGNDEAIAIEHGQNITIVRNRITDGGTGVRLWANATQDPNWGYPKTRDTRSHIYRFADNVFEGLRVGTDISRTTGVGFLEDRFVNVTTPHVWGTEVQRLVVGDRFGKVGPPQHVVQAPARLPGAIDAMLPANARRGRNTIIVDDWGPYDYLSPKIWPIGKLDERPMRFRVLGPPGKWRVVNVRGGAIDNTTGVVPGGFTLVPGVPALDLSIELEYVGQEILTPRGERIAAGTPFRFSYSRFDPVIDWSVNFWKLSDAAGAVPDAAAFATATSGAPARTEKLTRLAFANARSFGEGYTSRIAVKANGTFTLPDGRYELAITSDDGIRLWLDDVLVLEDWTIHGPKEDRVPISGGTHRLRLEYFQNAGAAALQVRILGSGLASQHRQP